MNATQRRTVVLGLDGFDFSLARRLAGRGLLPWFDARLRQGSLISTHGSVLAGSEWVNAACGVSAAHHGYLHLSQLQAGTYEEVDTDARVVRADPFYVPLVQAGVNTIVIDLPGDRPRAQKHLVQVIEWGREFNLWRYATTPKSVGKLVRRSCGMHPLTHYGKTIPDEPTLLALREKLLHGTRLKGQLARELMRRDERWDVIFVGFSEVHKGGHFFWKYQDPRHPDYSGDVHPLSSALVELYQTLDRECARVCEAAGEDVDLLVASDRGMAPNYRGDHLVGQVLERLRLFQGPRQIRRAGARTDDASTWTSTREPLARRVKRLTPVAFRSQLRRLTGRGRADWNATKVFQIAEVGTSYLRVNLEGREPQGTVAPGDEYGALLEFLEREFRALVNPATGRSPVAEVVFPQRAFPGPLNVELPDVGIVWAPDAPVEALESRAVGRVEGISIEQRSGNHTYDGGMLAAGRRFAGGVEREGDLRELAPTLLALRGVAIPPHYEFEPMPELDASR
jgi:predicted AlkP superfamily phosphohydrolase/phosphomutase